MSGDAGPSGSPERIEPNASASTQNLTQLTLSLNRVKGMIKEDPEVKSISTEACFAVTKATEQLLEIMAAKGAQYMLDDKKMALEYGDVANAVSSWQALDFLQDIIPQKVPAAVALARMMPTQQQAQETQRQQA